MTEPERFDLLVVDAVDLHPHTAALDHAASFA